MQKKSIDLTTKKRRNSIVRKQKLMQLLLKLLSDKPQIRVFY